MHPFIRFFITGLCLIAVAGCGISKPSRFYLLTPVGDTPATAQVTTGPALGLGPVSFPVYLDRPEIVHRSGDNQLHYAGSDRWAEPLVTSFRRTLAQNLSILLPTDRITLHPWPRAAVLDYQVVVEVTRFEAESDGTVILMAAWEIRHAGDQTVIKRQKGTYTEPAGSMAYPAVVAAQSRAVGKLSEAIAHTINSAGLPAGG